MSSRRPRDATSNETAQRLRAELEALKQQTIAADVANERLGVGLSRIVDQPTRQVLPPVECKERTYDLNSCWLTN